MLSQNKQINFWCISLLLFFTFIVYYPSLNYSFQFDDGPSILKLYEIRNLKFTDLFFSSTRWISTWISTLIYHFSQFSPFYYRFINLCFHILTGTLIFLFSLICFENNPFDSLRSLRVTGVNKNNPVILSEACRVECIFISILTTALFLLHPVQTQTVSYIIQGQLEGLSSLFIMSILLCSVFILRKINYFLIMLFSFLTILSTGTKEIVIAIPFLILLTDWFFISQGNFQKIKQHLWLPILNFFLILISYIYIKPWFLMKILNGNYVIQNNVGNLLTQNATDTISSYQFFISQFKVLLHYLWIYIWPFNISVDYDWKLVKINSFDFIFPFTIILTIFGLIFYLLKRNSTNLIAFGLLWFFILNAPRASIIPSAELVADYKTYLASFGWLLVLTIFIVKLVDILTCTSIRQRLAQYACERVLLHTHPERGCKPSRRTFIIVLISTSLILGYLTYQRNKVWQSGISFWSNIIKNAPNKARGYNNYGTELAKTGKYKEAIPFYLHAIKLENQYHDPYSNLAAAYAVIGDTDLAIETIKKGLQINANQPEAFNNLGAFYLHKQDLDNAKESFLQALKLRPYYGKAMYNLAKVHLAQDQLEESWKYFKMACTKSDIDYDLPPWVGYAELSVNLNKIEDAKFACKKIIEIAPKSPEAEIAKEVLRDYN